MGRVILLLLAACVSALVLRHFLTDSTVVVVEPGRANEQLEIAANDSLSEPPALSASREMGIEAVDVGASQLAAADEAPPVDDDRSSWTIYQWRELHVQNYLDKYAEATKIEDRVSALKTVETLAIATILDGRGLGRVNSGVTPSNANGSYGFSLNGVTYDFHEGDFPEYLDLISLELVLFTPAKPGESRSVTDEMHNGVLDRVAEAFTVAEGLGTGPGYLHR